MKKVSLLHMKEKEKGKIVEISGEALEKKLMGLGIYPGKEITKLSHFALRGPITIRVSRSVIALGHGMAGKIFIEK